MGYRSVMRAFGVLVWACMGGVGVRCIHVTDMGGGCLQVMSSSPSTTHERAMTTLDNMISSVRSGNADLKQLDIANPVAGQNVDPNSPEVNGNFVGVNGGFDLLRVKSKSGGNIVLKPNGYPRIPRKGSSTTGDVEQGPKAVDAVGASSPKKGAKEGGGNRAAGGGKKGGDANGEKPDGVGNNRGGGKRGRGDGDKDADGGGDGNRGGGGGEVVRKMAKIGRAVGNEIPTPHHYTLWRVVAEKPRSTASFWSNRNKDWKPHGDKEKAAKAFFKDQNPKSFPDIMSYVTKDVIEAQEFKAEVGDGKDLFMTACCYVY